MLVLEPRLTTREFVMYYNICDKFIVDYTFTCAMCIYLGKKIIKKVEKIDENNILFKCYDGKLSCLFTDFSWEFDHTDALNKAIKIDYDRILSVL